MTWQPDYVTVSDLKAELRITNTDDDAQVARWVTSASRAVDKFCHRQFGQVDELEERYYGVQWQPSSTTLGQPRGLIVGAGFFGRTAGGHWIAVIDDVQDTTGVAVQDDDGHAITGWKLLPRNNAATGKPYTEIQFGAGFPGHEVAITALWGWTSVPIPVQQAVLQQGNRIGWRRGSPSGVAGSPADGSELRLLAKLDPDVEVMLSGYRRETWFS